MKYTPRKITENVNISKTSPLREFFLLTTGILGTLIIIYLALGLLLDLVVPRISYEMEDYLSSLFEYAYRNEEQHSPAVEELQNLLDKLVSIGGFDERKYKIHLMRSPVVNAMAIPGGHIVVFSGLLEKLKSENELAMILGHELGHFQNRDHLRGLGRGLVLMFLASATLGIDSSVSKILQSTLITTEMKFSRKQELQSDEWGLELLEKMYGHAGGATDFFIEMSKEDKHSRAAYFFATHPYPEDRIKALQSLIKDRNIPVLETKPLDQALRSVEVEQK
ncbi:MAG: M48 family metallopeptidase [Thermodesulfobacteriota bacterium]